jgi:hypothetical protein
MRNVRSCCALLIASSLGLAAVPADAGIFIGVGIGRSHRYYAPPVYAPVYAPAPVYAAPPPPVWTGYGYNYSAPYAPAYGPAALPAGPYEPAPVYAPYAAPAPAYFAPVAYPPVYPYRKVEMEWKRGMYEIEYKR